MKLQQVNFTCVKPCLAYRNIPTAQLYLPDKACLLYKPFNFFRLTCACSDALWRRAETYVLLVLDIIYSYMTLMLFFGLFHCFSIICGAISYSETFKSLYVAWCICLPFGKEYINTNLIRAITSLCPKATSMPWTMQHSCLTAWKCADVTTKELSVKQELRPGECCCGFKHLTRIVKSWPWVCCAALRWRKPTKHQDTSLADTSHLPQPPV